MKSETTHWKQTLTAVKARRSHYRSCLQGVAAQVAEDFVSGDVIEIGAGLGQLAEWLGPEMTAGWTLTDPEAALVADLEKQHPQADCHVLDATALSAACVDSLIGLCVLDVIAELDSAARRFWEALRPGGRFIHLLDMTTTLPLPLKDVAEGGLVALPNVVYDPSDATWPEDLLLCDHAALKKLLRELRSLEHQLPLVFGEYFELYRQRPFVVQPAVSALRDLLADEDARVLLARLLAEADQLAYRHGWPRLQAKPVSTALHLKARAEESFSAAGFRVLVSDLARTWDRMDRGSDGENVYRSLCVGHERVLSEQAPARMLCPDAPTPTRTSPIVEAGVFVFVAEKPR